MKVLIANASENQRSSLETLLNESGYQTISATNGVEALECLRREVLDMILSDTRLPVMDGFEAMRRIRALPLGQNITIITVTASAFDHDRQQSVDAGSDDFIAKPFKPNELVLRIKRIFQEIDLV